MLFLRALIYHFILSFCPAVACSRRTQTLLEVQLILIAAFLQAQPVGAQPPFLNRPCCLPQSGNLLMRWDQSHKGNLFRSLYPEGRA